MSSIFGLKLYFLEYLTGNTDNLGQENIDAEFVMEEAIPEKKRLPLTASLGFSLSNQCLESK